MYNVTRPMRLIAPQGLKRPRLTFRLVRQRSHGPRQLLQTSHQPANLGGLVRLVLQTDTTRGVVRLDDQDALWAVRLRGLLPAVLGLGSGVAVLATARRLFGRLVFAFELLLFVSLQDGILGYDASLLYMVSRCVDAPSENMYAASSESNERRWAGFFCEPAWSSRQCGACVRLLGAP